MEVNTNSKQLLFTTVKITAVMPSGTSCGTGFIMDLAPAGGGHMPIIVTNKHVIEGSLKLSVRLIGREPDTDKPQLGQAHDFLVDQSVTFIGHPDPAVDVAAFPLLPIVGDKIVDLFYRSISRKYLPSMEEGAGHDALEDVTFVGYPNGWSDEVHHTPIFRRGITATPMSLGFGGLPVYLVDGSVFGGSSGSPVFLFNQGSYPDGKGGLVIGTRIQLVGVMAATMVRHSALPLAVSTQPHVKLAQEMNLGIAFNWKAIVETLSELEKAYGIQQEPVVEVALAQPE